jgi:DNA-binding CsgD family transcriptional regulator
VGKTRLLAELAAEAVKAGWQHAGGEARRIERDVPFAIFAHALAPLVALLDPQVLATAARGAESRLAAIIPALSATRAVASTGRSAVDPGSELSFQFGRFLEGLGRHKPLLITVENMQWADGDSLALLSFVLPQIARGSVVFIGTCTPRPPTVEDPLEELTRPRVHGERAATQTLNPFTVEEVADLVRHAFNSIGQEVVRFAHRLHEHTGGNAFVVEEVLRTLVERGELSRADGSRCNWSVDVSVVPASILERMTGRLAEMSSGARDLVQVIATVGKPVPLSRLLSVTGEAARVVSPLLEELGQRTILGPGAAESDPVYDFRHPIIHTAIAALIEPSVEWSCHERILAGYVKHFGPHCEEHALELAPHLPYAGDRFPVETVVSWYRAAGFEALSLCSWRQAGRLLSEGLALSDRAAAGQIPREVVGSMLDTLSRARQREGNSSEAMTALYRARSLALELGDQLAAADVERRLGIILLDSGGGATDAMLHLVKAEAMARESGDAVLAARCLVAFASAHQSVGRSAEGRQILLEALPGISALGYDAVIARAHAAILRLYAWTGPASGASAHLTPAVEHALASGDLEVAWGVITSMCMLAGLAGHVELVKTLEGQAMELADRLGSESLRARSAEFAIEYAAATGRWKEGLALAAEVLPIAESMSPHGLFVRILVWQALMLIEQDRTAEAKQGLDLAYDLAGCDTPDKPGDVHARIAAFIGRATYHLREHNWDAAILYAERGLTLADGLGLVAWSLFRLLPILCEAKLWRGDFAEVEALSRRLRAESEEFGQPLGVAFADAIDALLPRYRDGRLDCHVQILAAAQRLEELGFMLAAARLRLNAAQVLAELGLAEEAKRELRRAHELFSRMNAVRELRLANRELRSLGTRPPVRTQVPGRPLTASELEIARLVAQRMSNKAIAEHLKISIKTVETHVKNVKKKLGAEKRKDVAERLKQLEDGT